MTLSKTNVCDFGWKARDFTLKGVDGKTYSLADARGPKGTLVVFICNHAFARGDLRFKRARGNPSPRAK